MAKKTLINISWRYLIHHPWQSILMVLGIALGVAVVVAVDLANASASRAFDLSTATVAGKATHQITGGPLGLDESIYTRLRRSGLIDAAAPLISQYISSPMLGDVPLQLLGVDPFAEAPFRDFLGGGVGTNTSRPPAGSFSTPVGELTTFLTQPDAILLPADLADLYGIGPCPSLQVNPASSEPGCHLDLEIGGLKQTVFVAGLLETSADTDRINRRALENILLVDISTAQELTGRLGRLDRIDLILPENDQLVGLGSNNPDQLIENIQAMLPQDARLQPVEARTGTVEEMTSAFRINLTALSLLALVVGMFLIYNTMTFSVVQRRSLFGTLRCLGVTRREVFGLVLSEALVVGALGSVFGLGLGILLGQGAVRMVTQTINDLFFVVSVQGIQILPVSLIKGSLLGIVATLLTAAPPAWEASSVSPRAALSRSGLETKVRRVILLGALVGSGLLATGGLALLIPTRSLLVSFGATFAIVVGFALLVPIATGFLMRQAAPLLGWIWGTLGRMAPRDVTSSLSRTSIAVMALMVAVSVTIGVSLMVSSFRHTVVIWLAQSLQGDVYISAPSLTANQPSANLDPAVVATVRDWPGVARADVLRAVQVDTPTGTAQIAATNNLSVAQERIFLSSALPVEQMWEAMLNGAVIVSEPFANRTGLARHPGSISIFTDQGLQEFPVIGVYYDYASTQGTILMALPVYRENWQDQELTAIALRLEPGQDPDQVARELQMTLSPVQKLLVRPNQALREEVLIVFDRTFAITGALQLLATIVAFIGVLSALLSLELERQRELGILRAVGLTVRQLWGLIMLETGLMGSVAGLLAMPTGYALALILVYIINRRSFGWTLQMQVNWEPFLQALVVAVVAALLAGIYPARRMGAMVTSEALRSE
jgi:putative ABC transport system permease protein